MKVQDTTCNSLCSKGLHCLPFTVNVNVGPTICYFCILAKIIMVTHGLLPWPQQKTTSRDDLKFHPYNGIRNSKKYQTLRTSYPASILNYVMLVIRIFLSISTEFCYLDFKQLHSHLYSANDI